MKKISLRSGLMATTTICGAVLSTMAGGALVATVATMMPSVAQAQDFTSGAVVISVDDSSGAPVVGATVTLKSQAQGITKTLTTSASGTATATGLAPGEYSVVVTKDGFDTYETTATVVVSQEVTYTYALNTTGAAQTVVVKGKRVRQDFTKTTSGLSVDLTTLTAQQPIGRSIQAVTLLAPTAVNSTAFGQPSIGGGSAAENAFYINGLNVTNPDTFIGGAEIPFDFYKTVDVQTSGYSAEFGRATGGVVNATTKSGTNDFMFAVHGNFAPQSLRGERYATPRTTSPIKYRKDDLNSLTVEAGGAIIKDKLFLYGLAQLQSNVSKFASTSGGYMETDKATDPFYGLKADWYITPGQHLELTYFDTTTTTDIQRTSYLCPSPSNANRVCSAGPSGQGTSGGFAEAFGTKKFGASRKTGGPSWVAKYTGNITDWFTISAAYGQSEYASDFTSGSPNLYYAQKYDAANALFYRVSPNQFYSAATTIDDWKRDFYRADADFRFEGLGKHHVRMGFDHENVSMDKKTYLPGELPIRYYIYPSYAYIIYEDLGGHVSGEASSYYIQDSWDVTSTLNLQLGLRQDDFLENNLSGEKFLDLNGNVAPRLGISWKPSEDSAWRFTASYGHYFIPPAMNLGFRGKDLYFGEYFNVPGDDSSNLVLDANGIPTNIGAPVNSPSSFQLCPTVPAMSGAPGPLGTGGVYGCNVFGDGTQEPAAAKAAVGLKATRETEFTLGTSFRANDLWTFGLTYVNRKLDRVSEDTDFASQINTYCTAHSTTAQRAAGACNYANEYHVWNVGDSVTINTFKTLPDGTKQLTLTNLGFPKPERTWESATLDFKRAFDGKWGLQGSYTWSKSMGNYEGTVLSTGSGSGQTDAGSTMLYDYVHLTDYSYGRLINGREHTFKIWGSYAVTDNFSVGFNYTLASPSSLSCLGRYDPGTPLADVNGDGYGDAPAGSRSPWAPGNSDPAYAYGANAHYCLNTSKPYDANASATTTTIRYRLDPSPMGKGAKTDWTNNVDLSLRYTMPEGLALGGKLILRADIFNLFDRKEITARNMASEGTAGLANVAFKEPTAYNSSRYMRVGFDLSY